MNKNDDKIRVVTLLYEEERDALLAFEKDVGKK